MSPACLCHSLRENVLPTAQNLRQRIRPRLGNLAILLGRNATDANGTNDLLVDHDGHAAFNRHSAAG